MSRLPQSTSRQMDLALRREAPGSFRTSGSAARSGRRRASHGPGSSPSEAGRRNRSPRSRRRVDGRVPHAARRRPRLPRNRSTRRRSDPADAELVRPVQLDCRDRSSGIRNAYTTRSVPRTTDQLVGLQAEALGSPAVRARLRHVEGRHSHPHDLAERRGASPPGPGAVSPRRRTSSNGFSGRITLESSNVANLSCSRRELSARPGPLPADSLAAPPPYSALRRHPCCPDSALRAPLPRAAPSERSPRPQISGSAAARGSRWLSEEASASSRGCPARGRSGCRAAARAAAW